MEGIVEPAEELTFYDQVGLVKSFCYLGDRLNANGTEKTKIGSIKFKGCGKLLKESFP